MKTDFVSKKTVFKSDFGKKTTKNVVEYTSPAPEIESDCNDEINYLDKEFGKSKQKEIDSFVEQTDMGYYINIYFKNRAQKEQFLERAKLLDIVDEFHRFLQGEQFAKAMGVEIDHIELKAKGEFKQGKRFKNADYFKD